jgi:hypothetical protein
LSGVTLMSKVPGGSSKDRTAIGRSPTMEL